MGFACPVCEAPQADDEHLAHHLAITAAVHADEHEAWLDRHVPDWGDRRPSDLAPIVTGYADPVDFEHVFDDTTGDRPSVDGRLAAPADDDVTRRVLREARELTERTGPDRGDDAVDDQ